ncbi:MAG: hypothetical protein COA99_00030, partial [Moraxellaceae bacterium]
MEKIINVQIFCFLVGLGLSLASSVNAADLKLANTPMVISGAAPANVMMLYDTSGSMNHIVPEVADDMNNPYGACTLYNDANSNDEIRMGVDGSGAAYFSIGGNWSAWSTTLCFVKDRTYNNVSLRNIPTPMGVTSYMGNYLNWYFSNTAHDGAANFGRNADRKPGTHDRMEVAKEAAKNMIAANGGLAGTNVGLTRFTSKSCGRRCEYYKAKVVSGLVDIDDASNRQTLDAAIDSLSAYGSTPLATALAQVGRYFVEGNNETFSVPSHSWQNNILITTMIDMDANSLFNKQPEYSAGTRPTNNVIEHSCQKNFIIALTDGEPTSDADYSDILAKWQDGTVDQSSTEPGDLDDVAAALFDLDLRKDPNDDNKNNVVTHIVGFAKDFPLLKRAGEEYGGGSYTTADDPISLATAFDDIAQSINNTSGSVAAVTFNSNRLNADSVLFQAQFHSAGWSGSLEAFA